MLGTVTDGQHGHQFVRDVDIGVCWWFAFPCRYSPHSLLLSSSTTGTGSKPMLPPPLHSLRLYVFNQNPKGKGAQICYWLANMSNGFSTRVDHITNDQSVSANPQSENGDFVFWIYNFFLQIQSSNLCPSLVLEGAWSEQLQSSQLDEFQGYFPLH